jgi:hypothetical protein
MIAMFGWYCRPANDVRLAHRVMLNHHTAGLLGARR